MSETKFQCGLIEGYFDAARKATKDKTQFVKGERAKKSWPKDPAYEAGYVRGIQLVKDGKDIPNDNRMLSTYLGWRYGEE